VGHDLEVRADINVTSLVDVAFTLLVIFLITAPIMQGGIEVDVPQGDVNPLSVVESSLIVTLDRSGQIYMGETPVDRDGFAAAFSQLVGATQPDMVYIKGDSLGTLAPWFDIMSIIAGSQVKWAIVAEQRPLN
jgi:biopolymer transport protein TolR